MSAPLTAVERARRVRQSLPSGGLFAGHDWRVAPEPFVLGPRLAKEFDTLGRVLLQFYRAANLLYRRSVEGRSPAWVAAWLDQGKPPEIVAWQRDAAFRNQLPRVIRPDVLLTETGTAITELDSVSGGIGVTAWMHSVYGDWVDDLAGGRDGMAEGFRSIFGAAPAVDIVVSEESATYRPEMEWLAAHLNAREGGGRFRVRDGAFRTPADQAAVYRFFEIWDLDQVPAGRELIALARDGRIRLTSPPKAFLEEKLLLGLLWNRNLHGFWRTELGEGFFHRLRAMVPQTWVIDPTPLPPQGAFPGLDLCDWSELKQLSQRDRDLILKASGFSDQSHSARSVVLGSDVPAEEWASAVDDAIRSFGTRPHILQRFHKPRLVNMEWCDTESGVVQPMPGRARLCPYYFVGGEGDAARPRLGGVLATVCPADKKIIHGMSVAILSPCRVGEADPG